MFHTRIMTALSEGSTWAAISAAIAGTAVQVPAPYSYVGYGLVCVTAIIGIVLKDKGSA